MVVRLWVSCSLLMTKTSTSVIARTYAGRTEFKTVESQDVRIEDGVLSRARHKPYTRGEERTGGLSRAENTAGDVSLFAALRLSRPSQNNWATLSDWNPRRYPS